jgi:hypothetical protein
MKNLSHFSKTDIRFWQNAVFRKAYTVEGWRRLTRAAAAKARDIYLGLVASGWDATLARFKKPSAAWHALNTGQSCTVAQFFEAVARTTTNQSILEDYARTFRQTVSEIFGLSNNKLKYDYQSGGRAEWLSKVQALRHLRSLSGDRKRT